MAHPKHQSIAREGGDALDDVAKLDSIEGLATGGTLTVAIALPPEPEEAPVVLSDDEGLFVGDEEDLPAAPAQEILSKELDDADMDKQGELKQQAQELLEDGDLKGAVEKLTAAMLLGGVSAMMVAKRADMLMKQKRYKA